MKAFARTREGPAKKALLRRNADLSPVGPQPGVNDLVISWCDVKRGTPAWWSRQGGREDVQVLGAWLALSLALLRVPISTTY